jgi:putative glutamine amidotransferase
VRPLIAVTTTNWPAGLHQLPRVQLDSTYLTAVEVSGGTPLLLTPVHGPGPREHLLSLCSGLLLTGGEDVEPVRYGQTPIPEVEEPNPERDEAELAAVDFALGRQMPILAICRGMQLLNVALGGTLIQDIPAQRGGDVLHQQPVPVGERWHAARVEPGSRLARATGLRTLEINSFHHQAVDRMGEGLVPNAWALDGIVEGLEGTGGAWVQGVQWHPERGEAHGSGPRATEDPDRRLFAAFLRAAEAYAEGGVDALSEARAAD